MLWRGGQREVDKPGWREKLADWRDAPPWVPGRPDWLSESPSALLLLALGQLLLIVGIVYAVVAPQSLPAQAPGYFDVAAARKAWAATSTTTITTTTTTIAKTQVAKNQAQIAKIVADPEAKKRFLGWVDAVARYQQYQAYSEEVLSEPAQPPFRRWSYSFLALTGGVLALAVAWLISDTRARRSWSS
jgi:hypothetical protein